MQEVQWRCTDLLRVLKEAKSLIPSPSFAGLNNDCAVTFVNGDTSAAQNITTAIVLIEFVPIGPVDFTECRLTQNLVDGDFVPCKHYKA